MKEIQIKDIETNQVFNVPASANTIHIETKDGVRVKIHPVALTTLTKRGQEFSGSTLKGPRRFRLL